MPTKKVRHKRAPAPKIGSRIDDLYRLRAERLAAQKEVDALKEQERLLAQEIASHLHESGLERAAGQLATFTPTVKTVPRVTDWPALYRYIARQKAWDLLERRVSSRAFNDRLEDGKRVTGVAAETIAGYSLTKAGAK